MLENRIDRYGAESFMSGLRIRNATSRTHSLRESNCEVSARFSFAWVLAFPSDLRPGNSVAANRYLTLLQSEMWVAASSVVCV